MLRSRRLNTFLLLRATARFLLAGVFAMAATSGYAQIVEWQLAQPAGGKQSGMGWAYYYYVDYSGGWSRASAVVQSASGYNTSSMDASIISVQSGGIRKDTRYRGIRVWVRATYYTTGNVYATSYSLYFRCHAIANVGGITVDLGERSHDLWWGTEYRPSNGPHLALDIPNWDGQGSISLSRRAEAQAKASRTGAPAYVQAYTQTTVDVWAEGY